jgi:GNAT superfamily N-acetyltransferase
MSLELISVFEYGIPETAKVLNTGFSDYIVPLVMDLERVHNMLRCDGIDVTSSRVVLRDEHPVGVALIARRGWNSRLAGMAIIPGVRRQGIGRWLMDELLAEAQARADRRMELEVIEQNQPALALYQQMGFEPIRCLLSFSLESPKGEPADIEEIDMLEMGRLVVAKGLPNLPWQISGQSLALLGPPMQAYQLAGRDVCVAISPSNAHQITIRSLLALPGERESADAMRLLRALFAMYPEKKWHVPALFPEEFAPIFKKTGFQKEQLSQLQMEKILNYHQQR